MDGDTDADGPVEGGAAVWQPTRAADSRMVMASGVVRMEAPIEGSLVVRKMRLAVAMRKAKFSHMSPRPVTPAALASTPYFARGIPMLPVADVRRAIDFYV